MAFTSDSPMTAIIDQSNRRILEGYPFMIDCSVLGEDNINSSNTTTITWYRDGESLSTGESYSVDKSTMADTGTYYCVAKNTFGSVTSDVVTITIVHPGDDQFGVNLIKNGDAKDGLTGWTPIIGNFQIQKFWSRSGDRSPYGYQSQFPRPKTVDPAYHAGDGCAFFTAKEVSKRQQIGSGTNSTTIIVPVNEGKNLTTVHQDIYITDPDTVDIIDRKVEGVFDVECKVFAWLGQCRSSKVFKKDNRFYGGFLTPNAHGPDVNKSENGYEETIREIHDESKMRFEFFDQNDQYMQRINMDSFRPTMRKAAFAVGYRSLSIPPGTRRIRATMLFRRDNGRDFEWASEFQDFGKPYRCAISYVNCRLFVNKTGLKFPSLKFNPSNIIDPNLDDIIEQKIMDTQHEARRVQDLIEDMGNIQITNKITKDHIHPSLTGILHKGLTKLTLWAQHNAHKNISHNYWITTIMPGHLGHPDPTFTNMMHGPPLGRHLGSNTNANARYQAWSAHASHMTPSKLGQGIVGLSLDFHRIVNNSTVSNASLLAGKVKFFLSRPDLLAFIAESLPGRDEGNTTPWWEMHWDIAMMMASAVGSKGRFISALKGHAHTGGTSSASVDPKIQIAYALAVTPNGTSYPKNLHNLFHANPKGGGSYSIMQTIFNTISWSHLFGIMHGFGSLFWHVPTRAEVLKHFATQHPNSSTYVDTNGWLQPWLAPQYVAEFKAKCDDAAIQRVYDSEIVMTIKEIYDSVYQPDWSGATYQDCILENVPPCSLRGRYYKKVNEDDPDTWNVPTTLMNDHNEKNWEKLHEDVSESGVGEWTYSAKDIGNNSIGFRYPCARTDKNPITFYSGNNDALRLFHQSAEKIIWVGLRSPRWYKWEDLKHDMNRYTIMDYSLDDMVAKSYNIPALNNFFETTRHPIIFNEQISLHPAPFRGAPIGNFVNSEGNRRNTWHGYYTHWEYMNDNLYIDNGGSVSGHPFRDHSYDPGDDGWYYKKWIDHKSLGVPEFYTKSVLSGNTDNMPVDAPYRYQGANPDECLTDFTAIEDDNGVTVSDFTISSGDKINMGPGIVNVKMDKLLRTYALAHMRYYMLVKRIQYLQKELDESLDWVDTQGDSYGYDGVNTALEDD